MLGYFDDAEYAKKEFREKNIIIKLFKTDFYTNKVTLFEMVSNSRITLEQQMILFDSIAKKHAFACFFAALTPKIFHEVSDVLGSGADLIEKRDLMCIMQFFWFSRNRTGLQISDPAQ